MDPLPALAGVALAQLLAVISPGPSFLVVARVSAANSRVLGISAAAGLGVGSVIWASAALFGLQFLFAAAPWLYMAMKIGGAGYLLFLAWRLWRHAGEPLTMPGGDDRAGGAAPSNIGHLGAARRGLFTQLANPKVAVFFGSIFATLLPQALEYRLIAVLLPLVFAIEFFWYFFVARAFSTRRMRDRYARAKCAIDRLTGTFLAALGIGLVLDR